MPLVAVFLAVICITCSDNMIWLVMQTSVTMKLLVWILSAPLKRKNTIPTKLVSMNDECQNLANDYGCWVVVMQQTV